MKKMTLFGFVSHKRLQWIGSIFMYCIGVHQSSFIMVTFADAPAKGTFLTITTQTLTICYEDICSVDDLFLHSALHFMPNNNAIKLFLMNG